MDEEARIHISKLLFILLCADFGEKTHSQAISPDDSCILKFHKPSEVFVLEQLWEAPLSPGGSFQL